jgi:hypothetical protein
MHLCIKNVPQTFADLRSGHRQTVATRPGVYIYVLNTCYVSTVTTRDGMAL